MPPLSRARSRITKHTPAKTLRVFLFNYILVGYYELVICFRHNTKPMVLAHTALHVRACSLLLNMTPESLGLTVLQVVPVNFHTKLLDRADWQY